MSRAAGEEIAMLLPPFRSAILAPLSAINLPVVPENVATRPLTALPGPTTSPPPPPDDWLHFVPSQVQPLKTWPTVGELGKSRAMFICPPISQFWPPVP